VCNMCFKLGIWGSYVSWHVTALKMEATHSAEALAPIFRTTRRHIVGDSNMHFEFPPRCEVYAFWEVEFS
jgi:hypothetical protein